MEIKPSKSIGPGLLRAVAFAISIVCFSSSFLFGARQGPGELLQLQPKTEAARFSAQNSWNFIRGSKFDGISIETGLLDSWPEKGPPVVWGRSLGQGYSGFTGNNGRIFTQYQTLTGQYVACLDAYSGETIWEYRHSWPYDPAGLYPGPQSTPTLDEKFVYFTSPKGLIGCLRQDNGKVNWQFDLVERFGAKPVEFGYSCSPVLIDGKILLPVGGKDAAMVALRAADGTTLWSSGNDPISHASAFPIKYKERELVVGYFKNSIQIFDVSNGEVLSTLELSEGYDEHSSWPIYREPFLWISAPFRAGSKWLKISGDPPSLSYSRESSLMSNDVCSSVLFGESLYGFDIFDVQSKVHRPSRGHFRCLDFASGNEHWSIGSKKPRRSLESSSSPMEPQAIGHVSMIVADRKLIMLNDTGELIMAWADASAYSEIGRSRLLGGEICWTQPTLLNGFVYVRDHSKAVCVYVGADPLKLIPQFDSADDLPVGSYWDWSAIILSVEPEYAMTSPSGALLVRWYWVSLLLGWAAAPVLGWVGALFFRRVFAKSAASPDAYFEWTSIAFIFGIFGTTFLSGWFDEFLFTWQMSLAVCFQWLMRLVKIGRCDVVTHPITSRVMFGLFFALVFLYFLVCRRLSLAFEWCFLMGFPAAIPFLIVERKLAQSNRASRWLWGWLLTGSAFTAYYWTGAGIMLWWYRA